MHSLAIFCEVHFCTVKAAACRAVRKVYLALKKRMDVFITFPGHVRVNAIKEGFYGIAGN